jgi:hypothetical protein
MASTLTPARGGDGRSLENSRIEKFAYRRLRDAGVTVVCALPAAVVLARRAATGTRVNQGHHSRTLKGWPVGAHWRNALIIRDGHVRHCDLDKFMLISAFPLRSSVSARDVFEFVHRQFIRLVRQSAFCVALAHDLLQSTSERTIRRCAATLAQRSHRHRDPSHMSRLSSW